MCCSTGFTCTNSFSLYDRTMRVLPLLFLSCNWINSTREGLIARSRSHSCESINVDPGGPLHCLPFFWPSCCRGDNFQELPFTFMVTSSSFLSLSGAPSKKKTDRCGWTQGEWSMPQLLMSKAGGISTNLGTCSWSHKICYWWAPIMTIILLNPPISLDGVDYI